MVFMNLTLARKILEIPENTPIDDNLIKRQYKRLALKWHPDKCKEPNATDMYCSIKTARDYLLESPSDTYATTHVNTAMMFFETLYNNKEFQRSVLKPLLNRIVAMCETKAGEFIDELDEKQANLLLSLLQQNKDVLNLSDDFFSNRKIKNKSIANIVINPCLTDLFELNVYKMKRDDNDTFIYIPLWAPKNVFDGGYTVYCLPDLPNHIWIDEDNGLHVEQKCLLEDLLKNNGFVVDLPEKKPPIFVNKETVYLKDNQIICLEGRGLPSLKNSNHCLDVDKCAPLYIHLELCMKIYNHG